MINFEPTIYNAKVKFSYLGFDENNKLYIQLGFDYENGKSVVSVKKYLQNVDEISKLISVLDLKSWEEVARKFARIKIQENKVIEIGNLIDNRWVKL